MPAEYPPLGKSFVFGYDANDDDFPIVSVAYDPRAAGYAVPDMATAHPDTVNWPNHKLVEVRNGRGDDQRIFWIYNILPGPILPFTRYDDNLGPVQGTRQAVFATGAAASLTATSKITYEARDGSAVVDWKLTESWSDGTGSAGNPAYPILDTELYDDKRGPIQRRTQIVVRSAGPNYSEVATMALVGSVVTRTTYEPFNEFLLNKVVETWTVAGPELQTDEIGSENLTPAQFRGQLTRTTTEQNVAATYSFPTELTGDQVLIRLQQTNEVEGVLTIVNEVIDENADPLVGSGFAPGGMAYASVEQLVVEGTDEERGSDVIESAVDPLGNGKAVKQTRTARKRNSGDAYEDGHPTKQVKAKGVQNLTPQKYRRQVTTVTTATQEALAASAVDDIPTPADPSGNETAIEHEKVNDERYEKRVTEEIIGSGAALAGKVKTSEHGGLILATAEQLVTEGYTPPDNWLVLDESVDPLGNGKSVHAKRTATSPFPILYRDEYDQRANAMVRHTKQIVQNTNQQGTSGVVVTEYQPIDKWLTIQMTSKFAAEPSVISYQSSVAVPLPGVLTNLKLFYAGGVFLSGNGKFTPQFEIEPYVEITEAKMPPYEATIQEYFTLNPSAIVATGTEIRPKSVRCSGMLQLTATQAGELPEGTSWSGGAKLSLRPVTIPIPECLHGAINTIPASVWPGLPAPPTPSFLSISISVATMPIPATTPATLAGTIRYVYPPERYRFGYYYVKVATLTL